MRIYKYPIFHHNNFSVTLSLLFGAFLAVLLCAPQTLFADVNTLERIAEAEHKISYVGVRLKTFNWSRGTRTFEELVIHKAPEVAYQTELSAVGERKAFRGSRSNEHRSERHRDNQRRDRDDIRRNGREKPPEQRKWREVRRLFSKKEIALIAKNYNLEKSPFTEKIANHETDILTITPKFSGRPTHRIFFARENGVILRVETLDPDEVLRAILVYTRISFDPEAVERKWQVFQEEIKPEPQQSYAISLAKAEKILKTKPIQPEYLPPGFQLQDVHGIKDKKHTIHLIYTDGLLRFSIFETTDKRVRRGNRRGEESKVIDGTAVHERKRGPTQTFSWTSADIHFFLFGAMPAPEMEQVVKSIIYKTKKK